MFENKRVIFVLSKIRKIITMSSQEMDGWNERGAGRRPLPLHKKRESCHGIRLQAWWIFWLRQHHGQGGRMIERALQEYYQPDQKQVIKEYYEYLENGEEHDRR
jgi:hypothetical protein